jgi:hypothetical protein
VKESENWTRQPKVDEAADAIVATGKCGVIDVKGYQVAKALGCEPNGELYTKVRDWRRRRQDQAVLSTIVVPPETEAALDDALGRMTGEVKALVIRSIQQAGSDFERSKTLQIVDAERRRDAAEAETDNVLELWQKTEADLSDASAKIEELEKKLVAASSRETFLAGRLEQRNADWVTALRQETRDAEHRVPSYAPDVAIPNPGAVPVTGIDSVANDASGGSTDDAG